MTLVVIDAVGLTPRALEHMPRLSKLGADGFQARLDPSCPRSPAPSSPRS